MKNIEDKKPEASKGTKSENSAPKTIGQAVQQAQASAEDSASPPIDKDTLKKRITETKAQLNNLAALVMNCARIKEEKRVVIAEEPTDKDPDNIFRFAITGDIVVRIMQVVDEFIDGMKSRALTQQDKLIDEMNKYL